MRMSAMTRRCGPGDNGKRNEFGTCCGYGCHVCGAKSEKDPIFIYGVYLFIMYDLSGVFSFKRKTTFWMTTLSMTRFF
jgi:hypothetical protein